MTQWCLAQHSKKRKDHLAPHQNQTEEKKESRSLHELSALSRETATIPFSSMFDVLSIGRGLQLSKSVISSGLDVD